MRDMLLWNCCRKLRTSVWIKNQTFRKHCFNLYRDKNPAWVNSDQNSFMTFDDGFKLYYIYNSTQRDNKENFIKLLGQIIYIKNCLKQTIEEEISVVVLSGTEFSDLQKETLTDSKITFRNIEK